MRILVVDDEPTTRELVCFQLLEEGHEVDTAAHGLEAMGCLEQQRYDVIVTDLQMPGMDGLALCELARSRGHGGAWILMTGAHKHQRLADATVPVLLKPFRSADLLRVIERSLMASGAAAGTPREAASLRETGVHESPAAQRGASEPTLLSARAPREPPRRTRGNQT